MIDGLIPRRYAKALYKTALDHGKTKELYEVMKNVAESFRQNPKLQKVLSNPFIKQEDKKQLLISAAGAAADDDYLRFVWLILAHNREEYAYLMALSYRDIYRVENHISQVKITTASKLDDKEIEKLRQLVEKSFPKVTMEFSYAVDPNLIGGFVIDVDSSRMDASISNELKQLRQNLITTK